MWRSANIPNAWRTALAFRRALALQRAGRVAEAQRCCEAVLARSPGHFGALHLLGLAAARQGRLDAALGWLAAAVASDPRSAEAHANRANVLMRLNRPAEALTACERALALKPDLAEARAVWAAVHADLDRQTEAHHRRGIALRNERRYDEALASFDAALAIAPRHAQALNNRGVILMDLGHYDEALESVDRALSARPDFVEALNNQGAVHRDLGHHAAALASFDRALAIDPDLAETLNNRGAVLLDQRKSIEALASFDRALALKSGFAAAFVNRAIALRALKRFPEALASFDAALAIAPDVAGAWRNRGELLSESGRLGEAIADFERALALDPELTKAKVALLQARMAIADWRDYDATVRWVIAEVRLGRNSVNPFAFLGMSDLPQDQLQCARTWIRNECSPSPIAVWTGERYDHARIRIAYLSADFREHPLGYLMAGLFERHDRSRFETIAVSFGPDSESPMRARLKAAFERFIDADAMSDREVANLLRRMEVDIVVDRNGFTTGSRTGILAMRPAPIQVNYLAFPGTMGADCVDYVVADRIVIPPEEVGWYSEKVVHLPDSYQVNDNTRPIAAHTPNRRAAGLPESGFVFCSFNNVYKITPAMFDVWMRLLEAVDGSVLWLLEGNVAAPANLRREASMRGVAPERLVFAPRMSNEYHLARHRLADLFLDTLPCNAHTTASDALWAGLPVLTCSGTTFAGRVAESLLRAVGLPELVTRSIEEYESSAQALARDPERLLSIKAKLAQHRDRYPLYDTDRSRRHIEAAYVGMWERWQRFERPASFTVPPTD
ncbi:MAG: tetratricopeptide repeat protein [Betaproteobacteria bacterium]